VVDGPDHFIRGGAERRSAAQPFRLVATTPPIFRPTPASIALMLPARSRLPSIGPGRPSELAHDDDEHALGHGSVGEVLDPETVKAGVEAAGMLLARLGNVRMVASQFPLGW